MLNKIEIKLIDDQGNYSIAHIDYVGFVNTLMNHNVDMVHDTLKVMVDDYSVNGKMEIKKDAVAEHEKFRAPHKH